MTKNTQINNDEINLVEVIILILKGKWKIAAAIVFSVMIVFIYQSTQIDKFTVITNILPITSSEESKYILLYNEFEQLNSKHFNDVVKKGNKGEVDEKIVIPFSFHSFRFSKTGFIDFFIETLNEKKLFEDAIRKYNLLDVGGYSNEQEYNEAIIKLASSVEIVTSSESARNYSGEDTNKLTIRHKIKFVYHDAKKWIAVLKYVDEQANKAIKLKITNHFNRILFIERKKNYEEIEDLKIKIKNLVQDYDRVTSDKILYLQEQSAIAKKLGISKNTIEVQTFGSQNALFSSVNTDSPFYLRGYEAIDKEIALITSRKEKKAFIPKLFDAEKLIRGIEQDKTLERFEAKIALTPLANNNDFSAASIKVLITQFNYESKKKKLLFAALAGLIVGVLYILINNLFKNQKILRKN